MTFLEKKNQNILIVDDTPKNIQVIGTILKKEGYMISIAQSGKQALDIIRHEPPDLILLDIIMPEMDGFETCSRLKKNPDTSDIPVIFLSALSDIDNKVKGFSAGAVDYVTKPIQQGELLARVTTHLTIQRYREHLKEEVRLRTIELENRANELEISNNKLNNEIVERKQAEKELIHLRNMLSNIINSMPSVLVGIDSDGRVSQWNHEAEKETGVSAVAAKGRNLNSVFPQIAPDMEKVYQACGKGQVHKEEKIARERNGEIRYSDVMVYPLISNGTDGAVIRVDDVTEKVRMEELMVQNEKMLLIGGLAAGIAHEINSPLAGMMQTANVMADRLGKDMTNPANIKMATDAGTSIETIRRFMEGRKIPQMIETIHETGERMAMIVDNILSFARKNDGRASTYNISDLIDKTLELAMTDYGPGKLYDFKKIKIIKQYEDNPGDLICEGDKIQQVLLNILRNGAQAMQSAGENVPQFTIRVYSEEHQQGICIEIEDNGPGMDEKTRKRVFEPFFTTKSAGTGTGLGMSISCFIITENHGGEIKVESRPDYGAKFTIYLPYDKNKPVNKS